MIRLATFRCWDGTQAHYLGIKMKTLITLSALLFASFTFAANPTFNSFNTDQFVANAGANTIRANTNLTNPNSLVSQTQMVQQVGSQVGGSNFLTVAQAAATYLTPSQVAGSNFLMSATVTNWFVLTNGSDANAGTASNSATAFRTIQKAVRTVAGYWYTNLTPVSIQLGPGVYNENVTLLPVAGSPNITIGNETNAIVAPSSGNTISANGPVGSWILSNVRLVATNGTCIVSSLGASVIVGTGVNFGTATNNGYHMLANNNGAIIVSGNYTISGNAQNHYYATRGSVINDSVSPTITVSGTPAFTAFAAADDAGVVAMFNCTFSGSATGKRFDLNLNGVIHTLTGSATYFPGNATGTTNNGGQYQ